MKALIIYCSDYKNNTKKIAQVLASKISCEVKNIKDVNGINLDNYHLIGIGSGVYRENFSPKVFNLVNKLNLKGKNVFVYSTSGVGMKFYNKKLIRMLKSKGAVNKGSFACKGSFTASDFTDKSIFNLLGNLSQGHPNDEDYKNAERFILRVVNSLPTSHL